LWFDHD
jgi:hypothetical protein